MPLNLIRPLAPLAVNLGVMIMSLLAFALACELVLFRFVFLPADMPRNVWIGDLVRLEPHQTGVYRVGNEIAARFTVNAQGWNTGAGDYSTARDGRRPRIAVIGDSFVEALQVDPDESMAERLGAHLGAEVYRFGTSGAPLSQYLHMLEQEVVTYSPDIVVILLIHNDFDESFLFHPGRYTSSFLKLEVTPEKVVREISPEPYHPTWMDTVRQLAIVRYFYYRQKVSPAALRRRLFGAGDARPDAEEQVEANVETHRLDRYWREIEVATAYLFDRIEQVTREAGARLVFVMDGNRRPIYSGRGVETSVASRLNELSARLAAERGVPFLDLHEAFETAWNEKGERFEFERDSHWNSRGHAVAAKAVAALLAEFEPRPQF